MSSRESPYERHLQLGKVPLLFLGSDAKKAKRFEEGLLNFLIILILLFKKGV